MTRQDPLLPYDSTTIYQEKDVRGLEGREGWIEKIDQVLVQFGDQHGAVSKIENK